MAGKRYVEKCCVDQQNLKLMKNCRNNRETFKTEFCHARLIHHVPFYKMADFLIFVVFILSVTTHEVKNNVV